MKVTRLNSESEVRDLIKRLNSARVPVALDLETTGLDPRRDQLLTIVLGTELEAWCFSPQYKDLLPTLQVGLILHNFKFDYHFLFRNGVDLLEYDFRDTMLMHHLLDENKQHSLDSIITERWNDTYKAKFWEKYKEFKGAPEAAQDQYAGKDVVYTARLYKELTRELNEIEIPDTLIRNVHRFALALLRTEINGINLDLKKVKEAGISTLTKIDQLHNEMRGVVAKEIDVIETDLYLQELNKRKTDKGKARVPRPQFNFGSTQQLQRLLYSELKLPEQYSPQRKVTVDDNALAKLEKEHKIIPKLRDYRAEKKVFEAFLEGALEKQVDGTIYPSFNVNGTVTGRISASSPNLQQLPRTGGIRSIYIPTPGHCFISADYKQLEVTLAAHFSMDKNLLRVVNEGISLHDITAEGLGIDRNTAKTINFAIQYGAGVKKIQKILKCSQNKAEQALEKYWLTYPGLKALVDKCHACVTEGKAIVNPLGRQRHLTIPEGAGHWDIEALKRQAFNSLIQGTGADVTNLAFSLVSEHLISQHFGRALLVVHDEILIECLVNSSVYCEQVLIRTMQDVGREIGLRVPLIAESSGPMRAWED